MPQSSKTPRQVSPSRKTEPSPFSQFNTNKREIQKAEAACERKIKAFCEKNREIAVEVGVDIDTLNKWWHAWNEEKAVSTFVHFANAHASKDKASDEEVRDLLSKPKQKWAEALKADKKRRLFKALGCLYTADALTLLTKRAKLLDMG